MEKTVNNLCWDTHAIRKSAQRLGKSRGSTSELLRSNNLGNLELNRMDNPKIGEINLETEKKRFVESVQEKEKTWKISI